MTIVSGAFSVCGFEEQIFGAGEQVLGRGQSDKEGFGPTVSPQLVQSGKGRIASDPALLNLPRSAMAGAFSVRWHRGTNLWPNPISQTASCRFTQGARLLRQREVFSIGQAVTNRIANATYVLDLCLQRPAVLGASAYVGKQVGNFFRG